MGSNNENNSTTDLNDRFYQFSLKVILLVRKLPKEIAAIETGRQLVRSATSIIANYGEAKAIRNILETCVKTPKRNKCS